MNWMYCPFPVGQRENVMRVLDDGSIECCLATREDVVEWVAQGNKIEDFAATSK